MNLISFLTTTNDYFFSDKMLWCGISGILGTSFIFSTYVYFKILFTPLNKNISYTKTPSEVYIEKYKKKFHRSYNDNKYNQNIQSEFYNKEEYSKLIEQKDNSLEKSWKRRILMENTPQGNVIMFYDAYKLSFSYYSDNTIPYNILNAVAMKYVTTYFCRDFFIDKSFIPFNHSSPFLHVHEIDKKKPTMSTSTKIDVNKGPFAKFKNYTKDVKKEEKNISKKVNEVNEVEVVKDYIKNKFISLGKIYNYSMIEKTLSNTRQRKEILPLKYDSFKKWHTPAQFKMITDEDYHDYAVNSVVS